MKLAPAPDQTDSPDMGKLEKTSGSRRARLIQLQRINATWSVALIRYSLKPQAKVIRRIGGPRFADLQRINHRPAIDGHSAGSARRV